MSAAAQEAASHVAAAAQLHHPESQAAVEAGPPGQFVSAVSWSGGGEHLLTANSAGAVNLLVLAG